MKLIKIITYTTLLFLYSCTAKRIAQTQKRVAIIKTNVLANTKALNKLTTTQNEKLANGKIDSTINTLLTARLLKIKTENDSAQKKITEIESLINNKKKFGKAYNNDILPKLNLLENYGKDSTNRDKQIFSMLEDGLNTSNFILFDLAAFFGPGKYIIPKNKSEMAIKSFSPMLDSIIKFSNKYPTVPRTATLIILGFADGQGFNVENPATDSLKEMLGNKTASNSELNQKLSELRAEELMNILSFKFLQRVKEIKGAALFNIDYKGRGKGDALPLPYIKDYKTDDERRRIVLCYWAVLPD